MVSIRSWVAVEVGGVAGCGGPVDVASGAAGGFAEALGHAVAEPGVGVAVPHLDRGGVSGLFGVPPQDGEDGEFAGDVGVGGPAGGDHGVGPPAVFVVDPLGDLFAPGPDGGADLVGAAGGVPGPDEVVGPRGGRVGFALVLVASGWLVEDVEGPPDAVGRYRERRRDHDGWSSVAAGGHCGFSGCARRWFRWLAVGRGGVHGRRPRRPSCAVAGVIWSARWALTFARVVASSAVSALAGGAVEAAA